MPKQQRGRQARDGSADRDKSEPAPRDVDWDSPRWREHDDEQGHVERDRRLRGDRAPAQRGAVDDSGSIDPESSEARH